MPVELLAIVILSFPAVVIGLHVIWRERRL